MTNISGKPVDSPSDTIACQIDRILRELDAVEGQLDFGASKDLEWVVSAQAPVGELDLSAIGQPMTSTSAVASRLPAGPLGVAIMSVGDLGPQLDAAEQMLPRGMIPPPFDASVDEAFGGLKSFVRELKSEVGLSVYMTDKDQLALVLTGKVRNDAGAQQSIRKLMEAFERMFKAHSALVSGDPNERYKVSYRPDGLGFSGGKVDQFYLTLPKRMQTDPATMDPFVGKRKPKIEFLAYVKDGVAVLTIGAGGRKVMSEVVRGPKSSMEDDGGLALARKTTDGCQLCVAIDPKRTIHAILTLDADPDDKPAREALKRLDKIEYPGQVALGAKVEGNAAVLAGGVPQTLLYPGRDAAQAMAEFGEAFLDGF